MELLLVVKSLRKINLLLSETASDRLLTAPIRLAVVTSNIRAKIRKKRLLSR